MAISFKESKTRENLMRAFAGESQARNRYTFAASTAKKQNLHIVEAVFTFTAGQEKEHAEIFYNLLGELNGESIAINGDYPVNVTNSVVELLKYARDIIYPERGEIVIIDREGVVVHDEFDNVFFGKFSGGFADFIDKTAESVIFCHNMTPFLKLVCPK